MYVIPWTIGSSPQIDLSDLAVWKKLVEGQSSRLPSRRMGQVSLADSEWSRPSLWWVVIAIRLPATVSYVSQDTSVPQRGRPQDGPDSGVLGLVAHSKSQGKMKRVWNTFVEAPDCSGTLHPTWCRCEMLDNGPYKE